jgi:transcriptional regulator with XRE-family HTH domain
LTRGKFGAILLPVGIRADIMLLKTRVFDLYSGKYKNLSELAEAMDISVSQVYRVLEGKRNINRKFIIGAIKAFPGYGFDDLFYFEPEALAEETPSTATASSRRL